MLPLPPPVLALLSDVDAPPRLQAHLRLVHDVAATLTDWLRWSHPSLAFDREAVLFGAATHDIGKVVHPSELSAPGFTSQRPPGVPKPPPPRLDTPAPRPQPHHHRTPPPAAAAATRLHRHAFAAPAGRRPQRPASDGSPAGDLRGICRFCEARAGLSVPAGDGIEFITAAVDDHADGFLARAGLSGSADTWAGERVESGFSSAYRTVCPTGVPLRASPIRRHRLVAGFFDELAFATPAASGSGGGAGRPGLAGRAAPGGGTGGPALDGRAAPGGGIGAGRPGARPGIGKVGEVDEGSRAAAPAACGGRQP